MIRIRTIGAQKLWVPTHCWKAARFAGGETRAWLFPNADCPKEFSAYELPLKELESALGLDLFPDH